MNTEVELFAPVATKVTARGYQFRLAETEDGTTVCVTDVFKAADRKFLGRRSLEQFGYTAVDHPVEDYGKGHPPLMIASKDAKHLARRIGGSRLLSAIEEALKTFSAPPSTWEEPSKGPALSPAPAATSPVQSDMMTIPASLFQKMVDDMMRLTTELAFARKAAA